MWLTIEKLIGVPDIPVTTGSEIGFAVFKILNDWGLQDKVQCFVFNTQH